MIKNILVTLLFMAFMAKADAQKISVLPFQDFEKTLTTKTDTVYVVNFWATWCKPCVEELPYFLKLDETLKGKKFRLILVTLDFKTQIDSRVTPFLTKNNIKNPIILLDAPDANQWIGKVDAKWSGAIPATLIFNKQKRLFIEGELTYDELYQNTKSFF